jgi:predicted site-specific integrase-resolvase
MEENTLDDLRLFRKEEVAGLFRVAESTVKRYRRKGLLQSVFIGGEFMFHKKEVMRFLKEGYNVNS